MIDNAKFMDDYSRGMEMLSLSGRAFSTMARGLGYPVANESIPTAQVQLNVSEQRIEFHINPNFIAPLSDSDIAAVIAHETYHVLLNHLSQIADTTTFPKRPVLIDAQECIINDGLPNNVGFETMAGTYKGLERHNQDFSNFTTQEGYDFILAKQEQEEEEEQEQEEGDSAPQGGQGAGSGEPQDSDSKEKGEKSEPSEGEPEAEDKDKDSGSSETSEDEDSEDSDSSEGEGGSEGEGDPHNCEGPAIVGLPEGEELDAEKLREIVGKAISDALNGTDPDELPTDIQEALEELSDSGMSVPIPGYSVGAPKGGFSKIDPYAHLNVNWLKLLQEINPKMKTAGKPKYKDSWHTPRRRMIHSYPTIVLPTRVRLDDPNDKKGDSIPSFVIALDMSGSIPERLLGTLAGFAKSIPSQLIKAFPITWSNDYKTFDPERPRDMVRRGGTNLNAVMSYVRKVEAETGTKPYVLVITDGDYVVPGSWNADEIKEKWSWMAIQRGDVNSIKRTTRRVTSDERIFLLDNFI